MHACARELGIDEDTRRDLIERETGQRSAKGLSDAQLRRVIGAMDGRRSNDSLPAKHPMTALLRALWISGWHLGVVRDRTDAALCAYVAQALGLDAGRWAGDRMPAAVEEVKRLLAREGGVDWSPVRIVQEGGRRIVKTTPRVRVLQAQWRRLQELGVVRIDDAMDHYVCRILAVGVRPLDMLDDAQADEAIRVLGRRIRWARNG